MEHLKVLLIKKRVEVHQELLGRRLKPATSTIQVPFDWYFCFATTLWSYLFCDTNLVTRRISCHRDFFYIWFPAYDLHSTKGLELLRWFKIHELRFMCW